MKIKMVFDRWQKNGQRVSALKNYDLTGGDFHGGSTFDGTIMLDAQNEAELQDAIRMGFQPTFWIMEENTFQDISPKEKP